jgi:hypothetical protein
VTGCVYIIVEKNTPLTPLKRGIKKTLKSTHSIRRRTVFLFSCFFCALLLMRGFLFLPNDKKSPADLTKNPLGFSFKTCWILDYNVSSEFIA